MLLAYKETSSKVTHRFIQAFQESMKVWSFLSAFRKIAKSDY